MSTCLRFSPIRFTVAASMLLGASVMVAAPSSAGEATGPGAAAGAQAPSSPPAAAAVPAGSPSPSPGGPAAYPATGPNAPAAPTAYPPGAPAAYPPGAPAAYPPGAPAAYPPGAPAAYPPGAPAGYPPGAPMAYPPGAAPPMAYPPGAYPPGPYPAYPPGAYPGYAPPPAPEPAETVAEPAGPAPFRPLRFRADFGVGYFNPSDVNNYLESKVPSNAYAVQGFSDMVMLMSAEASVAYYATPFFGIRPTATYLFSPKVMTVSGGESQGFWLHSIAPGLSLDFAYDTGKLARFFASPGIAYQVGWLDDYSASGLGFTVAAGADLSFGSARRKGLYVAGIFRRAKLGIGGRPAFETTSARVNDLDFTSFLVCVGFQMGI